MNPERLAKVPKAIGRLTRVCQVGLSAAELPCDSLYDDIKMLLQSQRELEAVAHKAAVLLEWRRDELDSEARGMAALGDALRAAGYSPDEVYRR